MQVCVISRFQHWGRHTPETLQTSAVTRNQITSDKEKNVREEQLPNTINKAWYRMKWLTFQNQGNTPKYSIAESMSIVTNSCTKWKWLKNKTFKRHNQLVKEHVCSVIISFHRKQTACSEPFVKTVGTGFFKLFLADYSFQRLWQCWQLKSNMLPQIKICLENVHQYHKTWKRTDYD